MTEFIPVSSSGHLALLPWLFGWESPSLTFIVAAHLGTMLAVLIYFRQDWLRLLRGGLAWFRDNSAPNADGQLLLMLLVGTIPIGAVGLLFNGYFRSLAEQPILASTLLLVTAAILLVNWLNDLRNHADRSMQQLDWRDAMIVGLVQVFGLFVGISRSGVTIVAGRLSGLDRETAARFSFLLAVPAILGAGLLDLAAWLGQGEWGGDLGLMIMVIVSTAVTGYIVIDRLLNYLKTHSTWIFAIYCGLVGGAGLLIAALQHRL